MGRAPFLYKEPLVFNPLRWTKGINTFEPNHFTAFNIAPRVCLGKHFALVEAKVVMFHLLKEFKLIAIKPGYSPAYTLSPTLQLTNGMPVVWEKRKE